MFPSTIHVTTSPPHWTAVSKTYVKIISSIWNTILTAFIETERGVNYCAKSTKKKKKKKKKIYMKGHELGSRESNIMEFCLLCLGQPGGDLLGKSCHLSFPLTSTSWCRPPSCLCYGQDVEFDCSSPDHCLYFEPVRGQAIRTSTSSFNSTVTVAASWFFFRDVKTCCNIEVVSKRAVIEDLPGQTCSLVSLHKTALFTKIRVLISYSPYSPKLPLFPFYFILDDCSLIPLK